MSYILDALKKIEHDKNTKARPDGRVSISGDLFQERMRPAAKSGIRRILVLVALASLVTFAVTWFVLHESGTKSAPVISRLATVPPVPATPPAQSPVIPVPVQTQATPAPAPSITPPAVAPVPPVEKKSTEAGADDNYTAGNVRRANRPGKVRAPSSPAPPAQTVQAPADIKLSGIAWQEERTARRAVVNGFLLKEGAVVAGAKIIDIQADRVRFSSTAGMFEIKLDAVLPAGAQR